MSARCEFRVVRGSPTPEELCALLVVLRLAGAPQSAPARVPAPGNPWPVLRSGPAVPAVSWAAAPRTPAG
ncbi:acyl-CoA carboxylase subunit epsilon [Streptomyces sp. NPDC048603]|uniref:acyl-CoA carboxylase subunit epsilon n=1 Tax=Streptomyces sp. NPDC048603 TaxID=3365577 RepID=UPI00371884C5